MLNIEQLHVMPQLSRVESEIEGEGGYEYPEKFHGKVFLIQDKLVLFEKRKFQEYPVSLITALTEAISGSFVPNEALDVFQETLIEDLNVRFLENSQTIEASTQTMRNGLVSLEKNTHQRIDELTTALTTLADTITSLKGETLDIKKVSADVKEYTSELVNKELDSIYKNFEKGIQELVKSEVEKIKTSIVQNENKIKPGQIMMYKEMGLGIPEIVELKTAGLL